MCEGLLGPMAYLYARSMILSKKPTTRSDHEFSSEQEVCAWLPKFTPQIHPTLYLDTVIPAW
jgi:hypothetical protein